MGGGSVAEGGPSEGRDEVPPASGPDRARAARDGEAGQEGVRVGDMWRLRLLRSRGGSDVGGLRAD